MANLHSLHKNTMRLAVAHVFMKFIKKYFYVFLLYGLILLIVFCFVFLIFGKEMVCGVSTFVNLHFLSDSITKLASFHVSMDFIYTESDTNMQIYIPGLNKFLF